MSYTTILTSKGTTTIPKEIRAQLGIKPGMYVVFTQNKATGEYTIKRALTIKEVRTMNKQALKQAGTAAKKYVSGAGYSAATAEKFGKK